MTEGEKKAEIRNRKEDIRKKKQDRRSGGRKKIQKDARKTKRQMQ